MTTRLSSLNSALLLLMVATSSLAADATDPLLQKTMKLLAGEWETVSTTRDGKKLPIPEGSQRRVIIRDAKFTVVVDGKSTATGSFVLDPAKKPMAIDIKLNLPDGKEAKYLGIIEISEQEHRMCWADPGKQRPTSFAAERDSGNTLATYRRIKKP